MHPGDANRTEGQPIDWNAIDWRAVNRTVRNLRQRIFRATQEGDWDKVQSLQRLMLRSTSNVAQSVRRVTQVNPGKHTPGIDRVLVKTPEERGKLVETILYQTTPWRAEPVRRVFIPKANGKLRPLGIPTILNRTLQTMVKNALEPAWEAKFEAISFGFRPGRSAQDAMRHIWNIASQKTKTWILDADISGCFDNINHEHLLKRIGPFPAKELIRQWLKAGYVEYGQLHETPTGTPQGGPISPLLANISLHGMEAALGIHYQPNGQQRSRYAVIRYADDFIVMCKTQQDAIQAHQTMGEWLNTRGLQFSAQKTRIVHLSQGFDFLGFNVRIYPSRKTKSGWKTLIKPSKPSVQKIRKRLQAEWRALHGHSARQVIQRLNPIIRGWANYFRTQVSSQVFSALDQTMYYREIQYAKHMHPNKSQSWRYAKYFGKLNPYRADKTVFGDKETARLYLYKFAWTDIRRHTAVAGKNSPDDPALRDYWLSRERRKIKDLPPQPRQLARQQQGICPICGESLFIEEDIESHHIVPRKANGPNTKDNKLLIHYFCHQQLTAYQRKMGYL
jgi:RNA-directed DNA polymerase